MKLRFSRADLRADVTIVVSTAIRGRIAPKIKTKINTVTGTEETGITAEIKMRGTGSGIPITMKRDPKWTVNADTVEKWAI